MQKIQIYIIYKEFGKCIKLVLLHLFNEHGCYLKSGTLLRRDVLLYFKKVYLLDNQVHPKIPWPYIGPPRDQFNNYQQSSSKDTTK